MDLAREIINTCHESYIRAETKLGPDVMKFTDSVEARGIKEGDKKFIQRPEVVESYFILWRLTKDTKYRDWGWEVVEALDKHTKTDAGYAGIKDVYKIPAVKDDAQQSFFLAETLKYLYLLFSDDKLIDINQWVFNTEAHPLPIKEINQYYDGF